MPTILHPRSIASQVVKQKGLLYFIAQQPSFAHCANQQQQKALGNTAQFPPNGLSTAPADLRAKSRRKRRLRSEAPRCGSVCGTASALPKCSIRHPVLSALLA